MSAVLHTFDDWCYNIEATDRNVFKAQFDSSGNDIYPKIISSSGTLESPAAWRSYDDRVLPGTSESLCNRIKAA